MSEISDKSSEEVVAMSSIAEASDLVREIAGPHGSVKDQLRRAHRALSKLSASFSPNRVRDFYHADQRVRVRADEIDQLRRVKNQEAIDAAQTQYQEFADRLARLEQFLRVPDANFNRDGVDDVRGVGRSDDRAMDRGDLK